MSSSGAEDTGEQETNCFVNQAHFSYKWAIKIKTAKEPAENFLPDGSFYVGG